MSIRRIKKARDAGLYVIALDTPPDPADTVDITFATDNFKAGKLIGQWTAATLDGKEATIAMLDLFNDKVVSVDYNRDQGFLTGMGIDVKDAEEERRRGPDRQLHRRQGRQLHDRLQPADPGRRDGGQTAMENCLSKNPDINVVYTINEPAANGAYKALQSAGKTGVLIVSVDGGCAGRRARQGRRHRRHLAAVPAQDGLARRAGDRRPRQQRQEAGGQQRARLLQHGRRARDRQAGDGVDSITTDEATKICWG